VLYISLLPLFHGFLPRIQLAFVWMMMCALFPVLDLVGKANYVFAATSF
jgi:hypothetical protein